MHDFFVRKSIKTGVITVTVDDTVILPANANRCALLAYASGGSTRLNFGRTPSTESGFPLATPASAQAAANVITREMFGDNIVGEVRISGGGASVDITFIEVSYTVEPKPVNA